MTFPHTSCQLGELGKGAGKGGGGGGSIREAGGAMGKKQAAEEEMFFKYVYHFLQQNYPFDINFGKHTITDLILLCIHMLFFSSCVFFTVPLIFSFFSPLFSLVYLL